MRDGTPLAIVAFGGNALQRPGERGTADEMRVNLHAALAGLRPLLASGARIVLTHGNGPQVGSALLRSEAAAAVAPPHPLDVAGATTQGEIGSLIVTELTALLGELGIDRKVACVVTHVVVGSQDPALMLPTKPIGPFYDEDQSRALEHERGWSMVEDAGRGFRRVVGSPQPRDVLEIDAIRTLVMSGTIVVAAGGGGIPVARVPGDAEGPERIRGVEAVIDKDRTAALLANLLGADELVILTAVDAVYRDFGTDDATALHELTAAQARDLLASGVLPAGSMAPKVEAGAQFARQSGHRALITSDDRLADALAGNGAGTWIVP